MSVSSPTTRPEAGTSSPTEIPIDQEPGKSRFPTSKEYSKEYLSYRFGRPASGCGEGTLRIDTPLGAGCKTLEHEVGTAVGNALQHAVTGPSAGIG